MTTTVLTDRRTAVITDLPQDETQKPVLDAKKRWIVASEVHITYVTTRTEAEGGDPAPSAAVSVEVFGTLANVKATPSARPRPLVTYTDESGFPDWVAAYVSQYSPDKD
jgi:hypothetical protein